MADSLDQAEWSPPAPPLSVGEIQRGVAPVFYVRNERASDPFDGEFEHWSALPALSYFALNAVTLRESIRRIPPPTTFRPPPRLTLSDQRRRSWLDELKNPGVPLRMLSRAIPHGYTSSNLLTMLLDNEIPIFRAVWFIKCVGANEVRALKRKNGISATSETAEHRRIESAWLSEWTLAVVSVLSGVIDSFDEIVMEHEPSRPGVDAGSDNADSAGADSSGADSNGMDTLQDVASSKRSGHAKTNENNNANDNDNEDDNDNDDSMNELFGEQEHDNDKTVNTDNAERADARKDAKHDETLVQENLHSAEVWQKRIEYASRIILSLYNASLLDRHAFLHWVIERLRDCQAEQVPCFVHFVQLLWKPMTSVSMAPKLLRTIAHRYRSISTDSAHSIKSQIVTSYFRPLVFKLMSTNETAFVAPRTWPVLEPHVREHPAYSRIAERNQAFMPSDPHDPSDWSQPLVIGALLDDFARPYQLDDLMHNLNALDVDTEVLVRTILLRTLRQATTGSITLCIAVLKRLVAGVTNDKSIAIPEYCVEFLLDPHLVLGSECLGALVSELIRARLCYLDRYISKLISRDMLHGSGSISKPDTGQAETQAASSWAELESSLRNLHLRVLQDLPYDWLPPNLLTQVYTMLWRAGVSVQPAELDPLVDEGAQALSGKECAFTASKIHNLHTNDAHRLADRLVVLFEDLCRSQETMPTDPVGFSRFAELMDLAGTGSVRPLYRVLVSAVSSPHSPPAIVSSALRQVHIRLMAFVCSGLLDSFVRKLITKLDSCGIFASGNQQRQNVFQWVCWDDITALRAVIQSPNIMCDLNSLVPLRNTPVTSLPMAAGQTPVERDACVRGALYRPGCPDISTLLAMRGDEGLPHDIVQWAQSPSADKTALLQLLTYHAVTLDDLVDASADKFGMLRFFLFAPSSELGFCLEEVEALRRIRYRYLAQLPLDQMLELSVSVPPIECASRIAHVYPDLFINNVVLPAMNNSASLERLKNVANIAMRQFEVLFLRCTPFNLRFYQGLVLLTFHGKDAEEIADEVLRTAHAHPDASPALPGLLQNLKNDVKNLIFTKSVQQFLANGLDPNELQRIDVHHTLIGALASSLTADVQWSLKDVPSFLEHLVALANMPHASRKILRQALTLLLRISVIARLHNVDPPAAAVPYLEALLHIQTFADNFKMRTLIEDALRLLLRIARNSRNDRHLSPLADDDQCLSVGPMDGLRVYSKSKDQYDALPIWSFDLIEDANPTIGKNDGAIDLSLFEAYED